MKKLIIITLLFSGIFVFTTCVLQERIARRTNRDITVFTRISVPNGRFESTTVIAEGAENWAGGLKANGWTVVHPLSTEHTWSVEIVTREESVRDVRGNALKLTNSLNNREDASGDFAVQVYTTVEGIKAGIYQVEARIKGDWDENQAGAAQFKVECLDRNDAVILTDYPGQPGVTSDQFKSGELKTTGKNIWEDYQAVRSPRSDHVQYQYFTAPIGTTSIRLYCWFLAVGSVWFDNIAIAEADIGGEAFFNSDRVFLYPDEKGGNVEITLLQTQLDRYNYNFSVDFVLYDGEYYDETGNRIDTVTGAYNRAVVAPGTGIIDEKTGVSFVGGQYPIARYAYDISLLANQKHKYTLVATVWRNSGGNKTQIDLFKQNLYVYPRPKNIVYNADGKFSHFEMDGKLFNPIIGFGTNQEYGGGSIPDGGLFAAAKEAGINVVQTYDPHIWEPDINLFNAREEISKHGLKALVCLTKNHNPTKEQRERIIKDLANNPDVFAWQIEDEPMVMVGNNSRQVMENMKLLLEEKYREVRDIDDRAVYIVDGVWYNTIHETIKYCDILDIEQYPSVSPTTVVTNSITIATTAAAVAGRIKPVLYLTGSYYYQWERGRRIPTVNATRNNIYRGLEAGAKGVGYFCLHASFIYGTSAIQVDKILALWDTDLGMPIRIINYVEVPLLYDLFVNGKAVVLQQSGMGNEATSLFIRQWISQTNGKMYLLAHNRSMNNRRVNINLKNADGNPIGAYTAKSIGLTEFSKPDAISGNNNINLTLGPEEIALFEIEYGGDFPEQSKRP
jgi:hypothetical protein